MTIILLAFLLFWLLTPLLHARMGTKVFYLLATVPAVALIYVMMHTSEIMAGQAWEESFTWIPQLDLQLTFRMDMLSWLMSLLVLGVGSLVLFYCAAYFEHAHDGIGGFASHLFSFAGAMFGLITADDFIVMFIFWEITTILSYLLIGYSRSRLAARRSALQALTLTTAGGLAMFVGIIMLGQSAGTYSLHELVEMGPQLVAGMHDDAAVINSLALNSALVLILCGAFSKSALFPVHFWLPGAMAAPTPVSAYLHAAAMVKAGIYILIRLAPGYGEASIWHTLLVLFGAFTMLFGGWAALKQSDLKLILAYGTISQLGFIVLVISGEGADALYAAMAMMLAHSLFKAALFLTVGIIDHQAGTRDIHKLSGLYRRAPKLFVIGLISAASMAGLPPLAGFVAKEAILEIAIKPLHHLSEGVALLDFIAAFAVVVGSILTFAYSARFVWGAFAVKPQSFMYESSTLRYCEGQEFDPTAGKSPDTQFHSVSFAFLFAPLLLTVLTIIYGLYPEPVHQWISSFVKKIGEYELHLALWHGITPALITSLVIITCGVAMFFFRRQVESIQFALPQAPKATTVYRILIDYLDRMAVWITGHTQRGSLGFYLAVILITAVAVPTAVLLIAETPPIANLRVRVSPQQWAIAIVMMIASFVVLWARKRFLAILMVSVTGYGMSLLFALRSAPDLALTQLLVETVSMVAFVLAMRVLPRNIRTTSMKKKSEKMRQGLRIAIAVGFGVLMMALAMFTFSSRNIDSISLEMPHMAYEIGHGKNIVNVILVDIRGWDTYGEISVLALAATGIASLLYIEGRGDRGQRYTAPDTAAIKVLEQGFAQRKNLTRAQQVAGHFSNVDRAPYIVAGRTLPPERRSILLEVMTRLLFHTLIIVSLYMLVGGHNLPGGGFAGGLLVGLALAIRYLAGGGSELQASTPLSAGTFLGLGLGIAALYAMFPLLLGDNVFTSYTLEWHMPIFGEVKFVTATIFDIGVYLLVIGLVLDVLRSLGQKIDEKLEQNKKAKNKQRKTAKGGSR